jgi:protein SSD1
MKFRRVRFGVESGPIPPLALLSHLDDESIPVRENIFTFTPSQQIVEEISIKANIFVADKIFEGLPEKAILRRHAAPNKRRLESFASKMNKLGLDIDISSSAALQKSLFAIQDEVKRRVSFPALQMLNKANFIVRASKPCSSKPCNVVVMSLQARLSQRLKSITS